MPPPFAERLSQGVVVGDGAMGTMLYAKGIYINRCFDELNLTSPELVQEVHREYLAAGAELLETNTFGANAYKLALHGLSDRVTEINRRGVEIARGLVAYSSEAIERIAGLPTQRIDSVLGYSNGGEVIHRDDLVLSGELPAPAE